MEVKEASTAHFVIVHHIFKESYGSLNDDRNDLLPESGPCDPDVCEDDCMGTDHMFMNELKKKLSWPRAVLFVVGEILGGGVVAIGNAFSNTGIYAAIGMTLISLLGNIYISRKQAQSLLLIGRIDSRYRINLRDSYTAIVEVALGKRWKRVSGVVLNIMTLCLITIYLLISSQLLVIFVGQFTNVLSGHESFRIWLVILAAFLIPLTWFGTPQEFWGVALAALLTTVVAVIAILSKLWLDAPHDLSLVKHREITAESFFLGMGTIFFAFNGVMYFPNIQSDMKKKSEFSKAAVFGYGVIVTIYLSVALTGYLTLGSSIEGNILMNVLRHGEFEPSRSTVHQIFGNLAVICLGFHFVFGYNLLMNPTAQEIEEALKIPKAFCWQRCLIRSSLVLFTLALAEAVPDLSIFLSLVGGTLMSLLSYGFPVVAYLKLKKDSKLHEKILLSLLAIICAISVCGTTYSSTKALISLYS